ncbi:hypothetical protein H0H87_002414 [Tephrocybe sp. NHM501043]|nr:hypothetical protein H0H87_002414 [Tephrocybe sp. NHM501043]
MGTSLWLVSSEEDAEKLKMIMRDTRQSERPNLPASYPNFYPHITLLSFPPASTAATPEGIRAAIEPLLKQTRDLPIKFQSVDIGTHFFRSVYITITPSPSLLSLHKDVHAQLGIEPRTPLFPHLSLCYIDDQDASGGEREKFLQELREEGKIRYNTFEGGESVSLRCGNGEYGHIQALWLGGFEAKEVWVAKCDGPVENWKILDKIHIA